MKREKLLMQVAEKIERCEYTPIVPTKEEMPIWVMLHTKVYEELFNTKANPTNRPETTSSIETFNTKEK